ncbi:MAG: pseudoazurin [Rhodobacterales bacterium 34-62-10]|nr:MAG: pseudoazurin [Rhodobacterales bacterium 34-62-10]
MFKTLASALALSVSLGGAAFAETHEVKMLNKGSDGERMVFEPAFLQVAPGDTVIFVPTDKSHNAETVDGMMPAGATGFEGKINQQVEVTFDVEGLYAVICKPHYAMGMVMTVEVGDVGEVPATFFEGRVPKKAKERFDAQLSNL